MLEFRLQDYLRQIQKSDECFFFAYDKVRTLVSLTKHGIARVVLEAQEEHNSGASPGATGRWNRADTNKIEVALVTERRESDELP